MKKKKTKFDWEKVESIILHLWESGNSARSISRYLKQTGLGIYPASNINSFTQKFRETESFQKRISSLAGAKRARQCFDAPVKCSLCNLECEKSAWNNRFCTSCRTKYSSRQLNRFKLYGLKPEEFDKLLVEQSKRCKLCDCEFEMANEHAGPQNPCVDHCHKSGKVRGLLCMTCNWALERMEIPGWIDRAREYLR